MNDRLAKYRDRRDADRTPEPSGAGSSGHTGPRTYAFQQHEATSQHWDLRLEHRGVLLSWAVPKGPSTDPRERRLAIRTEDHPLDYADFEGTIPDGEYGAGSVIVWDRGTWWPRTDAESPDGERDAIDRAIADGHLSFVVDGQKLAGGYTLQRIDDDEDQWLLIKQDDDGADARRNPTSTEPESVVSGRTVEDVAENGGDG